MILQKGKIYKAGEYIDHVNYYKKVGRVSRLTGGADLDCTKRRRIGVMFGDGY
jgi:hypothetical protein